MGAPSPTLLTPMLACWAKDQLQSNPPQMLVSFSLVGCKSFQLGFGVLPTTTTTPQILFSLRTLSREKSPVLEEGRGIVRVGRPREVRVVLNTRRSCVCRERERTAGSQFYRLVLHSSLCSHIYGSHILTLMPGVWFL